MRAFVFRMLSGVSVGLFFATVVVLPASAGDFESVNKDSSSVAIEGYDSVAYFTMSRPVEGKGEFKHVWRDAEWRFSSAEHRDMFAGDPERYAPRYGGYCAFGMAMGYVVRIDPEAWVIVEDKLYLNYDEGFAEDFENNAPKEIARADENWEKLNTSN